MPRLYPQHIYEPIRTEVAISYLKHEFRKLLRSVPKKDWDTIDKDISGWPNSPELSTPRDFWNGFHGIAMGFKLKIRLIYSVTAENIKWRKDYFPVRHLRFGVELAQTKVIGEGKQSANDLIEFYTKPENGQERDKQLSFTTKLSTGTVPRDEDPIIVVQRLEKTDTVYSVVDGNRRLAKAVLNNDEKIWAYVGEYTTEEKIPKNYWIPTSILMEILFFARMAYESKNKKLFGHYMQILKDMLEKSESALFELKNRALTTEQPFRDEVFKALSLS